MNFGGIKTQNFDKSEIVIIPFCYEVSTSYRKGTFRGPVDILEASNQLDEIWGEEILPDFVKEEKIFTASNIYKPNQFEELLRNILEKGKSFITLGGEHSLTFNGVKVCKEKYRDLSVLQLDAHPDLRDKFENKILSHACVMRRVKELGVPITAVGIRSVDCDVADYIKKENIKNIFYSDKKYDVEEVIDTLSENVYLTIDLDVFDPSIMPSVGNPVPGGLGWFQGLDILDTLCKNKNVVGIDIVEFCPIYNFIAPDYLVAKLVYEIIIRKLSQKNAK